MLPNPFLSKILWHAPPQGLAGEHVGSKAGNTPPLPFRVFEAFTRPSSALDMRHASPDHFGCAFPFNFVPQFFLFIFLFHSSSGNMEEQNSNTARQAYSRQQWAKIQTNIRKVHETFYAPNFVPKHEPGGGSSEPLLHSSMAGGGSEMEAQQGSRQPASQPLTVMVFVKLFIIMAPFLVVCTSFGVLVGTGVDPLGFSMLALFLVIVLMVFVIVVWLYPLHRFYSTTVSPHGHF
jgi:hypothetical protein